MKSRHWLSFLPVLPFLVAGCMQKHADEDERAVSSPVIAVRTLAVMRGTVKAVLEVTGRTDAIRSEKVLSPIAGRVLSMRMLEGNAVRRGEVLALIQPRETRAAIEGAESLKRSARTEAEGREAARGLALALSSQNSVEVRATTDGVVASRNVTEGELVSENTELMTLLDMSSIVFVADVPLAEVTRVRRGQDATVEFESLSGKRFEAKVETYNPRADPQSQSVRVRLTFARSSRELKGLLKTEMNGIASIVTGIRKDALMVPASSLLRDDETDRYTIVVATADSIARVVPVEPGVRTDSTVEVRGAGLEAGMQVVVEGNYALTDSARLAPSR